MPRTADQPATARPRRTWLPMILWTAGILLALGLAWFVGAVVVPVWKVRRVVEPGARPGFSRLSQKEIEELGGPDRAARSLALYLRLPESLAPYKRTAFLLLGDCGAPAGPHLVGRLNDDEHSKRRAALELIWSAGAFAQFAAACEHPRYDVRDHARELLLNNFSMEAVRAVRAGVKDPECREETLKAAASGCDEENLYAFYRELKDEPGGLRRDIFTYLLAQRYSETAAAAALTDEDEAIRFSAALVLRKQGDKSRAEAAEAVLRAIAASGSDLSAAAAEALKEPGPDSQGGRKREASPGL